MASMLGTRSIHYSQRAGAQNPVSARVKWGEA